MKMENILIIVGLFLMGLAAWGTVGNAAECIPLREVVTYQGNSISIVGEVTPDIKEACKSLWRERQGVARNIVTRELTYLRTLAIEEAKIEVLGRLERLKGTNIYVRASSSSNATNDLVNTITNDLRATQTLRQSA